MGTKCAPAYANIFMGIFEETQLSISQAKSISDIFIASQI